ncbi:MAG TPA: hypothetical protein VFN74_16010 [Chloroflexota bacterium]|nr:hypothetical protein [Chloroflexota bacterium]
MANSTKNRAPEPKIGGAFGDTRDVSSNVQGKKADRDVESASSPGAGPSSTGSPAGDQVMDEKLQKSKGKRAA